MKERSQYKIAILISLSILLLMVALVTKDIKKQNAVNAKAATEKVENPLAKKTIINEPPTGELVEPKDNLEKDLPKLPDPPKDNF